MVSALLGAFFACLLRQWVSADPLRVRSRLAMPTLPGSAFLDSLNPSFAYSPTLLSTWLGCFCALGGLALGQKALRVAAWDDALIFVGSFGALSVLLFAAPAAPLGKPKNVLLGHAVSVSVGLAIHAITYYLGLSADSPEWVASWGGALEAAVIPAAAIAAMLYFGVAHPPAGACVAIYATTPAALKLGPLYILTPALMGASYCLCVQWCVAKALGLVGRAKDAPPPKGLVARIPLAASVKELGPKYFVHAATPRTAFVGSVCALGVLTLGTKALRSAGLDDARLFVGSAGALSTLLFAAPGAPLSNPMNVLYGHGVSAIVAVCIHTLLWGLLPALFSLGFLAGVLPEALTAGAWVVSWVGVLESALIPASAITTSAPPPAPLAPSAAAAVLRLRPASAPPPPRHRAPPPGPRLLHARAVRRSARPGRGQPSGGGVRDHLLDHAPLPRHVRPAVHRVPGGGVLGDHAARAVRPLAHARVHGQAGGRPRGADAA